MLYSFVKQLTHHIGKLKATHENEPIMKMAATYAIAAEKLFDSWGIPKSYLVFDDEDALAELMENELIAPEDAGYYPIDDEEDDNCNFECRCGDCCGCCAEDEAVKEMNICFFLSVILAAALTLAILIPVRDGVEDMKAAKRDLAIIEIAMREKEDER